STSVRSTWQRLRPESDAQTGTSPLRPETRRDSAPVVRPRQTSLPLPPLDLLRDAKGISAKPGDDPQRKAQIIEETLLAFGVPAEVVEINQGPTVTQFGVRPGYIERRLADGSVRRRKVKVSRITSLADDLALALAARSIRVEAPVPGRPYVGIEIPNSDTELVLLKSVLTSR